MAHAVVVPEAEAPHLAGPRVVAAPTVAVAPALVVVVLPMAVAGVRLVAVPLVVCVGLITVAWQVPPGGLDHNQFTPTRSRRPERPAVRSR